MCGEHSGEKRPHLRHSLTWKVKKARCWTDDSLQRVLECRSRDDNGAETQNKKKHKRRSDSKQKRIRRKKKRPVIIKRALPGQPNPQTTKTPTPPPTHPQTPPPHNPIPKRVLKRGCQRKNSDPKWLTADRMRQGEQNGRGVTESSNDLGSSA